MPFLSDDSSGVDDRAYSDQNFRDYFATFVGNGVFAIPSPQLQIKAKTGMIVEMQVGKAYMNGAYYENDENKLFTIAPSNATYARIDLIVLRLSATLGRAITSEYIQGVAASVPVKPTLTRNDDIWELQLAQIRVSALATTITQANITDTRLDNNVCGFVTGIIEQIDGSTLYDQLNNLFHEKQAKFDLIQQQEQATWQTQTDTQQQDYELWKLSIDNWKTTTIAQFQEKIGFNFDNQITLSGTYKTFDDSINKQITEEIRYTFDNKILARLKTVFEMFEIDGSIIETLQIFNVDGVTYFSQTQATTTFIGGKPRTEVISL